MRKSTPLKLGLSVKKASNAPKPSSKSLGSVFGDAAMPNIEPTPSRKPQHHPAPSANLRSSEKLATDMEPADSSVYAYDEVYDSIQTARGHIKKTKSSDKKPRYMEKLIETAKQRQTQHEVARERLLAKEREREGDLYSDKEVFVTSGYKEVKEERQRKVEEEEAREQAEESQRKKTGMAGFYREFLDRVDRDDVTKVATEMDGRSEVVDASSSSNHNKPAEQNIERNDTFVSPQGNKRLPDTRGQLSRPRRGDYSRAGARDSYSQMIERQEMERQERQAAEEQARQESLHKSFARRNDESAVEAAKQRYLGRMATQGRRVTTR